MACDRTAGRRVRSTSSTSMTSLPNRWVAKSGAPAGREPAARRRSARWPRRSGTWAWTSGPAAHDAARPVPCGAGSDGGPPRTQPAGAARPGRGRSGVAAFVAVTAPSWTSHVRSHTASRNHRSWVTTTSADGRETRCPASQATASTSRWLVGSSRTTQVVLVAAAARPARTDGARHRRARPRPGRGRPRPAAPRRPRACAARPPRRGPACPPGRRRGPVGVVQPVVLVEVADRGARGRGTPGRSPAPPGRSSAGAAWSCRRRCGPRCRSARRPPMPRETSVSSGRTP